MNEPKQAQKAPYEVELEPGEYWWCTCGLSQKQPFCDGSHEDTPYRPVQVKIAKPQAVFLCGCKRTKNPPFCDGTHKTL